MRLDLHPKNCYHFYAGAYILFSRDIVDAVKEHCSPGLSPSKIPDKDTPHDFLQDGFQELEPNSPTIARVEQSSGRALEEKLKYTEILDLLPAYRWLVGHLRRVFFLTNTTDGAMESIKLRIIDSLTIWRAIPDAEGPNKYATTFQLAWDLDSFLREQLYHGELDKVLGRVITLTGSLKDAQAMICEQYLSQTWPSNGESMLSLLKEVLRNKPGHVVSCWFSLLL